MAAKRRGKATKQLSAQLPNEKLGFSFEFYDTQSTSYCLSKWPQNDVQQALLRLKEVCAKTFNELLAQRQVYHFHPIDWSQTIMKAGFPDSRINKLEPFQFSLLGINNQRARVYGAYAKGTFYIVWFDLNHGITLSLKKHT